MRRRLIGLCVMAIIEIWAMVAWGHPLDAVQPGTWVEIPNSKLQAVLFQYPAGVPHGSGDVVAPWSGAAYDTVRDRLLVFGGGHSDSADNAVYAFDMATLTWSRLTTPTLRTDKNDTLLSTGYYPDATGQPDLQQPRSGHTYNVLQYVPVLDRFCAFSVPGQWSSGQHVLMETLCFNQDTFLWERKAPPVTARVGSWTAVDAVTGHIWQHGTVNVFYLAEYNPASNTWTQRSKPFGQYEYMNTAVIDPVQRQLVSIPGCRGSGQTTCSVMPNGYTFDISKPGLLVSQPLSMVGAEAIAMGVENPGVDYDPGSGLIVAWNGGPDVYTLNTSTRTWTRVPPALGNSVVPTPPAAAGTFGRWRYSPTYDVFILVNSVKENVFIYRMP